jgi:hypothetical protein
VQCQNKGIKFVYCKFCVAPVAKNNFVTRHKHTTDVEASTKQDTNTSSRGIKRTASEALQEAEVMDTALLAGEISRADSGGFIVGRDGQEEKSDSGGSSGRDVTPKKEEKITRRQRRWLSLLDERPPANDHAKMKLWLTLAVTMSDPSSAALSTSTTTGFVQD